MMQVVAVFVDCFPFIRGSHFVDPVWVVVQLVFGRGGYFFMVRKDHYDQIDNSNNQIHRLR